jgi:hypothetical protein
MYTEGLKLKGIVSAVLRGPDGKIKQEQTIENLVVTGGLGFITDRMQGTGSAVMSHMGVGTTNTAPATAQTTLSAEIGTRASVTPTRVTTTVTNDTAQYVATFAAGNATGALVEAGLFNASSAGTMLSRVIFSVINKGALDSLDITWKIQLTAS